MGLLSSLAMPGCGGADFDTPFTMYSSIAFSDLDGDGRSDIAMSSAYLSGAPPHPGHAVVLLRDPAPAEGFSSSAQYTTGSDPGSLLVEDLNGDGKPDLVVANEASSANVGGTGTISILLQDPGTPGKFLPGNDYPTGRFPKIALGDVDGDGRPDIVVATAGDPDGISWFRNSPSNPGAFEPPVLLASLTGPRAVVVQDLDGDGRSDIVVATSDGILILAQDGSSPGSFLPAVGYAAGSQPMSIAAGDLDADGRPDLAVANYGSVDGSIKGSASVLLQDPGNPGTFLPTTNYTTGFRSISIAIGDLNGDGRPDLAVANPSPLSPGPKGNVSVLFQDPVTPGSFLPAATLPAILQPLSVAIGDLDGDGKADIVVADEGAIGYYQDPLLDGIFSGPVRIGP